MSAEIRQTLGTEQSLALTPQLKRSLEILQAPSLELANMIAAELKTNPLLEEMDTVEIPESLGEKADDFDAPDFPDSSDGGDAQALQKSKDFFLNSIPDRQSLQEYLLSEAAIDAKNPRVGMAFANLTGSLDERGFLLGDALDNARAAGFSESEISEALKMLRACEPSGIGAFDMRDSLMLQLSNKHMRDSLAYKILDRYYELLMKRKVADIAAAQNVSTGYVEAAIAEIAKLKTSPAADFEPDEEHFISADVIYNRNEDGEMRAQLVRDYIPKLKINSDYRQMLANGKLNCEGESYVREKIRDGKSLLDAVEQRQKTLGKIADCILERQREFFERGVGALKPMTMQDIADEIGVHSTTVGRAVSNKYAETPFGLFPLKFFFACGYETGAGESMASSSVKNRIREIVDGESPSAPMSDAKIASVLESEGLSIARRTVAKYREELGIAPKNLRKRF